MRTINNLLQSSLKVDLQTEIVLSIEDTAKGFVSKQREQLMAGERSDGENIFNVKTGSDEYSPSYAKKKGRKKPIDLRDKGGFHADIFIDVRDKEIVMDSGDSKSEMLQEDFGVQIFGLGDARKLDQANETGAVLQTRIVNQLNIK